MKNLTIIDKDTNAILLDVDIGNDVKIKLEVADKIFTTKDAIISNKNGMEDKK